MGARRKLAGIDLGTTYSAIAHFGASGRPEIVPNADGERTTPSVVLYEDGRAIVGSVAKNQAVGNPKRVLQHVKRHLGDPYWHKDIDGRRFTPEIVSALILRQLVRDAGSYTGSAITDVVIGCPAYFNDAERRLTKEAGAIAGLNVIGIINEPTAAALAYGLHQQRGKVTALVFDLGGGTFDVTVLEIEGHDVRVLATDGERRLGGMDWDQEIIDFAAEEFKRRHAVDPREDLEARQDLLIRAELAKKALSTKPRVRIPVQCGGHRLMVELTRKEFEERSAHLLEKAEDRLEQALEKSKRTWDQIDKVLRVGGSTRMPAVLDLLARRAGKKVVQGVDPDEVVAIGATYWAGLLAVREARLESGAGAVPSAEDVDPGISSDLIVILDELEVQNVNSHSLGVVTVEKDGSLRNLVMIPEQTPIPHQVSREFQTAQAGQKTVEARILEGASQDPAKCVEIGRCVISGLPPERPKGARIRVTYRYAEDNVLHVRARDLESGKEVRTEVKRLSGSVDREQLDLKSRLVNHLMKGVEGDAVDPAPRRDPARVLEEKERFADEDDPYGPRP